MTNRLPAEWEAVEAVIIAWPHELTDWNYMLDEVEQCYIEVAHAIARHSKLIVVAPNCQRAKSLLADIAENMVSYIDIDTNDTWARDFGPLTTVDDHGRLTFNDFKFNGWGLKFASNLDNLITKKLYSTGVLKGKLRNCLSFVLEGGSIESDGKGTLLTTSECLLSPNRNGGNTKEDIESTLKETLGAERIMWIDNGALQGDDTDSHIDTLARLAPDNTILYVGCDNPDDENFEGLKAMEQELKELRRSDGLPYNLIALPSPDPIYDEDGMRLPATYANFLILNNAVLLPIYGQEQKDFLASQMLKIAFPDHIIEAIDCNALIKQHGSLHCITMQFPKNSI